MMSEVDISALGLSSDFVMATYDIDQSDLNSTTYRLFDVYNCQATDQNLNVTLLGSWNYLPNSSSNDMMITLTQEKIRRRSNLFQLKIKASFLVIIGKTQSTNLKLNYVFLKIQ